MPEVVNGSASLTRYHVRAPCTAGALAPAKPLQQDILHEAPMLGPVAPLLLKSKRVQLVQGQIKYFTDRSAVLLDGSILQPDVVLYATGYTAQYDFLPPEIRCVFGQSVEDEESLVAFVYASHAVIAISLWRRATVHAAS